AARFTQDLPDFPWGFTAQDVDAQVQAIDSEWGSGVLADLVFGASAQVPGGREQWGRFESSMASPRMARTLWRSCVEGDVRDLLDSVRVPTLVMARPGDHMVSVDASAALAAAMPNAQFLMFPPGEHHAFDVFDVLVSEIFKFCGRPVASSSERTLATVMFTD